MNYLDPSEYVAYGLAAETADAWVAAASAMIDAHCRRASLGSGSYTERVRLHKPFGTAQLTYGPIAAITAVKARFTPHREERGESVLMEYALVFGMPGQWITMDPATVTADAVEGTVQLPPNLYGLPYSEAEISYTAGLAEAPAPVKIACAQIVKNAQATPGFNVSSNKLDALQTTYFSDSLLDSNVKLLLRPFVAERLG
jgi:hypothetical protein